MSFSYTEIIPNRYLQYVPDPLRLDRTDYVEARLIRLLLGSASFTCDYNGSTVLQLHDFSGTAVDPNLEVTSKGLRLLLRPLKQADICAYLRNFGRGNENFFQNLLAEVSYYFYQSHRGCHTAAFVHIYRVLEFISYSFPLIYTTTFSNHYKTYDALRSYFAGGDKQSEIKFLRLFADKMFEGDPILLTTADLNIVALDAVTCEKVFKGYRKVLRGVDDVIFDDALNRISIPYGKMIDVIYTVRCRYFHFATGGFHENIKSLEVGNPDVFFESLNKNAMTWLAMIYFKNLAALCLRWK